MSKENTIKHKQQNQLENEQFLSSSKDRFGFMRGEKAQLPENFDRLHEEEIVALFEGSKK